MNKEVKYPLVSARLREALNNKGLSQKELSEKSGVSKYSISQYVNGSHCPNNISASRLASVLNVSPLWIMGFDVPMVSENEAETHTMSRREFIRRLVTLDFLDDLPTDEITHQKQQALIKEILTLNSTQCDVLLQLIKSFKQ